MLRIDDTVLLVIDVQGRLVSLMHNQEQLFDNLDRMIKASQVLGIPILWTEQAPEKIGYTVDQIKDLLHPAHKPIVKYSFSAWGEPVFEERLQALRRSKVIIVGIETQVCIYQTARDLKSHGYEVHVVADAVSSRQYDNKTIAIDRMRHEGIVITSTELAICELLQTAKHPKFKEVMAHIKR